MKKMKKFKFGNVKVNKVDPAELSDRLLLVNLYLTQGLALFIGLIVIFFQKRNLFFILELPKKWDFLYWGAGLAVAMLMADVLISKIVPEESMDDGGLNEKLFKGRPVWHIVLIAFVVGICEELLFRGAIQHGIGLYWTSVLFAAIHFRYLRHWIPTGWVFLSSYGLGFIYEQTGTLWAPIVCHFLIDLISGLVIKYRRET